MPNMNPVIHAISHSAFLVSVGKGKKKKTNFKKTWASIMFLLLLLILMVWVLISAGGTLGLEIEQPIDGFKHVPIESVRSFWDRRPCNSRHSRLTPGTRGYFEEVEHKKYRVEPHIAGFADFEGWRGKRVLEIGCGIGTETVNFARAGADLYAVDLSPASLNLTRQRLQVFGLSGKLIEGNAENLDELLGPELLGSFDLVWSFGVIHHTPFPTRIIGHVRNYLKPSSGEFRFMVYSKVSYKLFDTLRSSPKWSMDPHYTSSLMAFNSEAQLGSPVTQTYTFAEITRLLSPSEWVIGSMKKKHIFVWDIDEYIKGNLVKEKAWEGVSSKYLSDLEEELGWHLCVVARLQCQHVGRDGEL